MCGGGGMGVPAARRHQTMESSATKEHGKKNACLYCRVTLGRSGFIPQHALPCVSLCDIPVHVCVCVLTRSCCLMLLMYVLTCLRYSFCRPRSAPGDVEQLRQRRARHLALLGTSFGAPWLGLPVWTQPVCTKMGSQGRR